MIDTDDMTDTDKQSLLVNDRLASDEVGLHLAETASRMDSLQSTVTLIKLGLRTNLQWLERDPSDVSAAIRTLHRVLEQVRKLEKEVRQLA